MTTLNPYLSFRDNAKEAMTYYQAVFGGELSMSTFGEFHASEDASEQDKIMHAMLTTEKGMVLMGADTPNGMDLTPGTSATVIGTTPFCGTSVAKPRPSTTVSARFSLIVWSLG